MNRRNIISVAQSRLRETLDEIIPSIRSNGNQLVNKVQASQRSRVPLRLQPSYSRKGIKSKPSRFQLLLAKAGDLGRSIERKTVAVLNAVEKWENRFILRRLDGLLEHLDVEIVERNLLRDTKTDWVFAVSALEPGLNLESLHTMNVLYAARCPVQRIDVGLRGVAGVRDYTQWLESAVLLGGDPRPGLMKGLRFVIDRIQRHQLAWKSYLVYPVEKIPQELDNKLRQSRLSEDDLHLMLLSLFHPVSDFNLDEWVRFKTTVGMGGNLSVALVSKTLKRLPDGLLTNQGVGWRLIQIKGLGVIPKAAYQVSFDEMPINKWDHPDNLPLLQLRTLEELRRKLLPLIEDEGQEIRVVTTAMPIRPQHQRRALGMHRTAADKIRKLANKSPHGASDAEMLHRVKLIKSSTEITGPGQKSFHGSVVLAVRGNTVQQIESLYTMVTNLLDQLAIYYELPQHRVAQFEKFKSLLPTIRYTETGKHVFLYPSGQTKQVFRVGEFTPPKRGVFLGRVLQTFDQERDPEPVIRDEPFVIRLGGNSVYIGAPGSGKSMTAKLATDRLLGTNKKWFGRLMDNTEAATMKANQLRGWNGLVKGYNGKIVQARDFESEDALRARLKELSAMKERLVMFVSQDVRPDLDEVYLRWVQQDIQDNNPGIFVVDECANWFKHQDDVRGGLYVDHLLNQFTANSYMSVTTIQVLGAIRESIAHAATYRMLMGLAQAGIYIFYTPDSGSLQWDLNIAESHNDRLRYYITTTIDGFKTEQTGTVDQPGLGVLYSSGKATLFMVESDPDTLREFARKDPEGEETYFGL